jgi:two-component system, OmpR family, sensor histidine kinase VicK
LLNNNNSSSSSSSNGDTTTPTTVERTEIFRDSKTATEAILRFVSKATTEINACLDAKGPSVMLEVKPIKKARLDAKRRGVKFRYITEITKDNIDYCKGLLEFVDELRHLNGIKGNFELCDKKEYIATATLQKAQPIDELIHSNVRQIVEQEQFVFDTFWSKAVPSKERIREIEEGIEPEFFDVTTDRERVCRIFVDLASSAKEEMLALLPNDKSIVRLDRLGVIDHMIRASQNGAIIKIICPLSAENSDIVRKISEQAPNIRILNGIDLPYGMYIADNKKFLRAELKVPNADNISESVGFATYSNSKLSVESSKSIFELLWNERMINEELKRTDKMQKEFINIAAHELRTPIQPILSLSQLLQSDIINKSAQQQEFLDAIVRNAKRLQRLTENILDVTRIESQSLQINKERFNLNEKIRDVINDVNNQVGFHNNAVSILFEPKQDFFVEADKVRIYEVISNLLKNAIQFTKGGTINIAAAEKVDYNEMLVSVKDTGKGIDPEIMPRLFTKFATKSVTGTGLGLYISRSIIEAHGGRMWAQNNPDGRGATFYFSLPLSK